jgi:hypothetical protein
VLAASAIPTLVVSFNLTFTTLTITNILRATFPNIHDSAGENLVIYFQILN